MGCWSDSIISSPYSAQTETIVQPGSLDCEAGIYASSFDVTGTRFLTCETDKVGARPSCIEAEEMSACSSFA
jgi:hypothetical protein